MTERTQAGSRAAAVSTDARKRSGVVSARAAPIAVPASVSARLGQRLGAQGARSFLVKPGQTTPAAAQIQPSVASALKKAHSAARRAQVPVGSAPSAGAGGTHGAHPHSGAHAKHSAATHPKPAAQGALHSAEASHGNAGARHAALAPLVQSLHHRATTARHHTPTVSAVAGAQSAALHEKTEQARGAAHGTVEQMGGVPEEKIARESFKAQLEKAIEEATPKPKTEDEADQTKKEGGKKASRVLRDELSQQRGTAETPMKNAADPRSDLPPGSQPKVQSSTLKAEAIGAAPVGVDVSPAVPAPLPAQQLDYSADRGPTDQVMAENGVTTEQLHKGNDPAFGPSIAARDAAETHEAAAAPAYRMQENKIQTAASAQAHVAAAAGLMGLHQVRGAHIGKVAGQQVDTRDQDAAKREEVTAQVTAIKNRTKADVTAILESMDGEAATIFDRGLARADDAYEAAFKESKGGVGTWLTTWGDSWDELIADSLKAARAAYMAQVRVSIDEVASFVESKLQQAKTRVQSGREELDRWIAGLDSQSAKFGLEARATVGDEFTALEGQINEHRDALVNKLTEQYKASYTRMEAREEELREANKSLWRRVYDATVGLIKRIIAFKNMLLEVLAKAAGVIGDIISDPIGFLGNLIDAVMQGLKNFMSRLGVHLQKGLMDWLFGALAGAGLKLPDKFDLQGIVSIVLQVLGLSYANFRARAVMIVGEPVVAGLEQTAEVFKIVLAEGIGGLWRFISDKVTELKATVLDSIFSYIKEKVLMAGVTWIIGLLNPASAFFKACKAIYDIVMFFIERGSQILELVNAVIDSVSAIVKGNIANAALMVENALAKAIPVAIGFLASLLGLGDPSKPVKETIQRAQGPVNKAIDWVIHGAVKLVKAAGKFVKGFFSGKDKGKGLHDKIGEKPSPASVKKEVVSTLAQQLTAKHSVEQARTIVAGVASQFRPLGVSQILLLGPDHEGQLPIVVEMSPGEEVAFLTPGAALSQRGRRVLLKVEFTLSPANEKAKLPFIVRGQPKPARSDNRKYDYLPSVTDHPQTVTRTSPNPVGIGGIVFPEEGGKIQLVTWNTSKVDPKKWGNETHAEQQFETWVDRLAYSDEGLKLLSRVIGIEAHLYDFSPCVPCGDALMSVARKTPNAQGNRTLTWHTLYVSAVSGTTRQEIGLLQSKWNVNGPTDGLEGGSMVEVQVVPKPRK